jgi:hypothetical protein
VLFGYPIEAAADNWLHDCLAETLRSIHADLEPARTAPNWPEILPAPYRAKLRTRTGLRDRLLSYRTAAKALTSSEREFVLQAFDNENKIALLLSGQCSCEAIGELPVSIRQPVRDLFDFAFQLLAQLGVRDGQYSAIYETTPYHVCPFCGCEYFDAPGAPREELDHFLARSKYPFAAANLRNLVPMGHKCNACYKGTQDILYKNDGTRRKAFDPYNHAEVRVSLDNSVPFMRMGRRIPLPLWCIEFDVNSEEVTTWDEVFHLRERYERDILDECFPSWLMEFGNWCKAAQTEAQSDQEVMNAVGRFARFHENQGLGDRSFLKAAVFRMLQKRCAEGNTRLVSLIKDLVQSA